ncbi:putative signal peptide protein [Puccinia sorghi]|uniref:Putative signal peptide protein n=1 Tax=Puccinia sorghi TaxID=27349 RepID=A0A0L6UXD1_9BASI|nr:putative signal peptide protein [Puccinia sorghi]
MFIFFSVAFVKLLNQVRMGKVTEQTIEIMASFTKPVKCNNGTLPIKLSVTLSVFLKKLH